jgi:hypothetical protein
MECTRPLENVPVEQAVLNLLWRPHE